MPSKVESTYRYPVYSLKIQELENELQGAKPLQLNYNNLYNYILKLKYPLAQYTH